MKRAATWLVAPLVVMAALTVAAAKEWQGAVPGRSTREQIIDKFGPPFKEFSKGGKLSNGLSYQGDQAIKGALEANFYFDKNDVLFRIDVFPVRRITVEQIKRIFGTHYLERVSKKGFRYFYYPVEGMAVFFEKDGKVVHSFTFTPGQPQHPQRGGKRQPQQPSSRLPPSAGEPLLAARGA